MKKYKKNTVLAIDWIDAKVNTEWLDADEAEERPEIFCQTVGYYLKHDKEIIWLSSSIGDDEQREQSVIPIGCITRIEILQLPDAIWMKKTKK